MHPGQVLPEQQNEEKMHGWLSQDGDFCNWPFVKDAAGTVIPPSIAYVCMHMLLRARHHCNILPTYMFLRYSRFTQTLPSLGK